MWRGLIPLVGFTGSLDYEGEITWIIGTAGVGTSEAHAMAHLWGYVIINDMIARGR